MSFERVPEEVALLNEIARLQLVLQALCNPQAKDAAARALRDQQARLEILKEQRRSRTDLSRKL